MFPRLKTNGAYNTQGYFDLDNMFINGLPDDYHLQFSLKLPSGMPQSVQLASPMNQQETWGLSYYVYAYVTNASAVEDMLGKQQPDHMFWTKLSAGKKSSKVFLSFSKQFVNDPAKLTQFPSSGEAVKSSFLSSSSEPGMKVVAKLDKPAYTYGDIIGVDVKITNPKRTKINGIKVNVKQLVTIKVGGDPKNAIKTCIGRYSFSNNREDMISVDTGYHHSLSSLKDVEVFSDTLKIRPHIDPMRYLYQLALESKLPRSEQGAPILASSTHFDGGAWPLGGGLDRVRTFTVEYYLNVHIDIPWAKDLIIKLPFKFVSFANGASLNSALPSLGETLNAPIFANIVPSKSGLASRSGTIMEDLKDLRPVPSNLINFVEQASPTSTSSPTFDDKITEASRNPKSQNRLAPREPASQNGPSFSDDIVQAKSSLVQLRSKLQEEQQLVLKNVLDSHSLLLRFDPRRQVLVKEFLSVLEEVVMVWLPQMSQKVSELSLARSMADLSLFDPVAGGSSAYSSQLASPSDDDNDAASSLVQNTVGRLGMFHSQLVQFQAPRSVQEDKLEALNSLVDDVELMLTRVHNGLSGKFDDAGQKTTPESARELIGRIQRKALNLASVIPLYDRFDQDILRLRSKIASYGMLEETMGSNSDSLVSTWGQDFDAVAEQLAAKFEAIGSLMANPSITGSSLTALFSEYVELLNLFIQQVPSLSDRSGVAFFWQWQYLHCIVDTYYCGGVEHTLILPDRKNINWSHQIKSQIPAQWDLVNHTDHSAKLQIVGTRVIAAMQQLVDAKFSS